ncbi:hypothetical protein DRH29_02905 [candidate division Kazan bacterium]|uniref:Uncharacterized protein n=1 Tax=candidate division Kazan bacterium TaxID=2202143 RepID=A0A420ZCM6_UNCK3|nr:MAG: hypothetical protein DRH29_02905 [candidate division Kazan bacterium]
MTIRWRWWWVDGGYSVVTLEVLPNRLIPSFIWVYCENMDVPLEFSLADAGSLPSRAQVLLRLRKLEEQ